MSATIRPAQEKDVPELLALQRRWVAEGITHGLVEAVPEEFIGRLGPYFLVAEQSGDIVGFISGSHHQSSGLAVVPKGERYLEIDDVYVIPRLRGTGVGGQLLDRLEEQARSNGIDRFLVYSASKDVDGILKFYRSHGFNSWYVQMYK